MWGCSHKHAKNKENAVKFLEYLASPEAQNYFANGNNEWPAVKSVTLDNPALKAMTGNAPSKSETIPHQCRGSQCDQGAADADRVGFQ